jgi:hypothetical protein
MTNTYRLKAMVFVRMLSEVTLFLVFMASPVVLYLLGKFVLLSVPGRAVFITLAVLGACLLPFYGFITWQVTTDASGITCVSLFKKQFCEWSIIRGLSRRSSFNWLRYVIETRDGEVSFPVLLKNCDQLVDQIRERLPAGGPASKGANKRFEHDSVAAIWQFAQALFGFIFIAIIWTFSSSLHLKSSGDWWLLLGFCIAVTIVLLWRTFVVALMPRWVQITDDNLVMHNLFFERSFPWSELRGIKAASPFLPEGFMINTPKMSYLVGANMNAADELQEILLSKIPVVAKIEKRPH